MAGGGGRSESSKASKRRSNAGGRAGGMKAYQAAGGAAAGMLVAWQHQRRRREGRIIGKAAPCGCVRAAAAASENMARAFMDGENMADGVAGMADGVAAWQHISAKWRRGAGHMAHQRRQKRGGDLLWLRCAKIGGRRKNGREDAAIGAMAGWAGGM